MSSSGHEHPDGVSARSFRRIAGIGALKDLGDGTGEVKSMRPHPSFLRRGLRTQQFQSVPASHALTGLPMSRAGAGSSCPIIRSESFQASAS